MHKADNDMVMSLRVSGEYVVIGYYDGTVRCLAVKKRGGGVDAQGGQWHGDVIAGEREYVVIGYYDGTVRYCS